MPKPCSAVPVSTGAPLPPRTLSHAAQSVLPLALLFASTVLPIAAARAATPPSSPSSNAPAGPPRTIAVAQVHSGMIGYGLTVFQGTTPERFAVKVIGVLRKFLPQQDIILIESDDPRLVHSGIVAGMSGSPIYLYDDGVKGGTDVTGRLAGALAYGWHFAKDPVAGVTPIENMLAETRLPVRGKSGTPVAAAANDPIFRQPSPRDRELLAAAASSSHSSDGNNLTSLSALVPASVPLSLAGFSPASVAELSKWLEPWNVTPLAIGGGAPATEQEAHRGPARFEAGGALAVQLIRGDMSAAATGTVTWVDGDKVLAFGHPMFNLGELYLPVATAEVHTILASVSSSFKIASPIAEAGTLIQDRQAGLFADMSQRTDMIPVHVTVGGPGRTERAFSTEVVRHRFLTPILASAVVSNATQAAASDVADATFTVHTALGVRGQKPLELIDHAFASDGLSQRSLGQLNGLKAIGEILFNPFSPANLERIDVRVDVEYRADVAEIVGLSLHTDALEPGTRPSVQVTLRPYNGPEFVESVPIDVPHSLAGTVVRIEAAAGNVVKPDQAAPESFTALIDNLRVSYPASSIVVTLQSPDDGLALRGKVLLDLPGSVLDTLRPGATTRHGETFKSSVRVVLPTKVVVVGKQEIQVKIKDEAAK